MRRVLIVDDKQDVLDLSKAAMEVFNPRFTADFARSAMDALRMYQDAKHSQAYDCIVTDVAMPEHTGLNLAQSIRTAGDKRTALILYTGEDKAENEKMAQEIGVAAYLVKPILPEELFRVIERVLDQEGGINTAPLRRRRAGEKDGTNYIYREAF